jgi:hypothetical protein
MNDISRRIKILPSVIFIERTIKSPIYEENGAIILIGKYCDYLLNAGLIVLIIISKLTYPLF